MAQFATKRLFLPHIYMQLNMFQNFPGTILVIKSMIDFH